MRRMTLYYGGGEVGEGGVMQTLAQSGSTKTVQFRDKYLFHVHEEGPPHYEEKAEIERTSLLQVG